MIKSNSSYFRQNFPLLLSLLILIAGSLFYIILNDVWIDEGSSMLTSLAGPGKAVGLALAWEEQAPFYYLLLSFWLQISQSYYFARILSLLFAVASLIIYYQIIKKYEDSKFILSLFLLLFVSNHFTIFAASTIRYYSFVVFLSLSMFHLFLNKYTLSALPTLKTRILFIVLASIAVLTQYYLSFLLFAFGMTIWLSLGFARFRKFCIDMIIPGGIMGGLAFIILGQYATYTELDPPVPTVFGMIEFIWVKFENSIVAFNYFPQSKVLRYIFRLFYLIVLIVGFINIRKLKNEGKSTAYVLIVTAVLLVILYCFIHTDFINLWHTMFFFVNVMLIGFYFISVLPPRMKIIVLAILICANFFSAVCYYKPVRDTARVISYLEKDYPDEVRVLVYPNLLKDIFQVQYKVNKNLVTAPRELDCYKGFRMKQWIIKNELELDSFFQANKKLTQNKFIFCVDTCYGRHIKVDDLNLDLIDSYLQSKFKTKTDTSISTYRIRQYLAR